MAPRHVVVAAGVSGSGKTTLGEALARQLCMPFEEGDTLHPSTNVAKMRRGTPLDDADRAPWLDAVARWIGDRGAEGGVISCSALKRSYRDRLRSVAGVSVRFVVLRVDAETLRVRLNHRHGHFMPASLLDSQLATLELPTAETDTCVVDGTRPVSAIMHAVLPWLQRG